MKQRIGLIVATALTIALCGTTRAGAETAEGRQACTNDAFQFCSEFIPDRERVFRCLEARKQQISAACRATMPAEPAPERPTAKRRLAPTKSAERKAPATKSYRTPANGEFRRSTLRKQRARPTRLQLPSGPAIPARKGARNP